MPESTSAKRSGDGDGDDGLRGAAPSVPGLPAATRAGLIETARRLDPLVLRWAQ